MRRHILFIDTEEEEKLFVNENRFLFIFEFSSHHHSPILSPSLSIVSLLSFFFFHSLFSFISPFSFSFLSFASHSSLSFLSQPSPLSLSFFSTSFMFPFFFLFSMYLFIENQKERYCQGSGIQTSIRKRITL